VVTSAIAQEGKSLVASHLGAVAAMLSKKTLIIDGHLLQPKQHNWFDLEVQPGLTDTVTDKFSLSKAVQSTDIENLSVLASGISTANSCMVMESPAMETIIQEASMEYDFVIIDTSPATASYDAYTLDKYSDGLLLVTQPLYTPLNLLEETVAELKKNRTSIIGFVTNNTDEKQQPLTRDRAQSSALVSLNHN
jgi:capsular exopolysaccharide synthesis family protein